MDLTKFYVLTCAYAWGLADFAQALKAAQNPALFLAIPAGRGVRPTFSSGWSL